MTSGEPAGRTGTLTLDGGHLVWELTGVGPTVVLLHGFSLDRRMWDDVRDRLADECRVVTYDLRGFGQSAPMDLHEPYDHATDLVALLDHLGVDSAVVVGFSFAARAALALAQRSPSRVSHLVLVDALLEGVPWDPESRTASHAVSAALHDHGIDAAKQAWLDHPFFQPARERPELAQRLATMIEGYGGRHWLGEDPHQPGDADPLGRLAGMSGPTTVLVGERDVPGFREMATILARAIPGARLETIPASGHMSPMEAPDVVAGAIRAAVRASTDHG